MKILAVIPARAGSKGIPNKNIRLLNGKPLIYYSIKNALESKYINEVIVSTDSKEVEIIAKQMGATVKWRDKNLSGDDVTLDGVIHDASKSYKCDYIVTMQPTSPTLTVKTLDNAIEYAINNTLDTVISVINRPHLAWEINEDGKKIPSYKERLNRQYLPSYFLETGAFVISKSDVVTENTRIGRNIDVYEISENEAIDIDTFADLKYCEDIMKNQTVAFYVNGNTKRGMGHIYRCLELADEFYVKPDIYYDINQTDKSLFGETTHNLIGINGLNELLQILEHKKYDIFINDILNTTLDYMIALKNCNPAKKIINFEDDGEGIYKADLVINALYQDPLVPQMKAGKDYYICAKTFMFYNPIKIKETVENIFISFGGADPQNYTDRLLEIIKKDKYKAYKFKVVIGRAKENLESILKYNKYEHIEVLYDIRNMPEIMSQCDIGLTSRGRTGYELAILGVPTIAMAQNSREEKHGFVSHENGFEYIGLNPNDSIIEANLDAYISMSREERLIKQSELLRHDLRHGRKRVLNLINSL
ncbi:cytidyltransferase [Paraclostridium bifermentans]|uniref:Cytidyltransferase n=2 Tax=Paraclostridium bifermentans TaxID=1490 RepID=A0AA44DI96_PARBF|nr:cytidyltransferase [Paraclostridium bifermentans]NME08149.1 cytidyltransferase [Paraclostridium bifermentans]